MVSKISSEKWAQPQISAVSRSTAVGRFPGALSPSVLGLIGAAAIVAFSTVVSVILSPTPVSSAVEAPQQDSEQTEPDPEADAMAEQLREGQQVYSQICSSCHQPGGAGLAGQYPPLVDNPSVDDAAYVADVIINGVRGEIVVAGETYNGVMPSFSTLSDEDTAAVIAYIQAGFVAPAGEAAIGPTGPVAGTELPALTNLGAIVAYLLAAGIAALVLAPRLLSENSRLNTPWLDAWLKTAVIVTSVVFLIVVVPDWALKRGQVTKLSRFAQDLIGTGLWAAGLGALLFGLWYAHRESRI